MAEGRKDLFERRAERPGHDPLDGVKGLWGNIVLKLGQLPGEFHRNQVGPGGEDLAEFDIRGAEFFQGQADPFGPGVPFRPDFPVPGNDLKGRPRYTGRC